jgi:hypothetical protein
MSFGCLVLWLRVGSPAATIFIVWLCFYHNFSLMGPTINCGTAAGYKKQQRATSCDEKMDEQ